MPLPDQPSALVVDDDDAVRTSMAMLLSLMGILPERAESGHAALQLVRERRFDLAIVDLGLPDIDGSELVRALRAMAPDMTIVIMSGDNGRIEQAKRLGNHGLQKPISAHSLRAAIDGLLTAQQPAYS